MALAAAAKCATHPDVSAVEVCQRCGTFVCGDCLELVEGAPFCTSCFKRSAEGTASRQAVASLVLSIIGLNCGFLPGIVGLILASRELSAIERNEAPIAGRSVARAARVLGLIDVALLAAGVVAFAVFVVRRISERGG